MIPILNKKSLPNYDGFFANPEMSAYVIHKVNNLSQLNKLEEKPVVISREASLRIIEKILEENLLEEDNILQKDVDRNELNMFKSFLLVNEELNRLDLTSPPVDDLGGMAKLMLTIKLSTSDLGIFGDDFEFLKIAYAVIYRFEQLLDFLHQGGEAYAYLLESLLNNFNTPTIESLKAEVKHLILLIVILKSKGIYEFTETKSERIALLDTLVSVGVSSELDYLGLRKHPLLKFSPNTYSIIDPYFLLDKFTKGIKFLLKEIFDKHNNLTSSDRTFFSFYNEKYSEEFLAANVLKEFFSEKRFFIHDSSVDKAAPDFYARQGNDVYLFECKDVLIAKEVKVSRNTQTILDALEGKFLNSRENGRDVGIKQITKHIEAINAN